MINPKELLFAVDENNKPIKPVPRSDAHAQGMWHRSIDVWILDEDKVLCQKRSAEKDVYPSMWEPCAGGHLAPGDTYSGTARRELEEEFSISMPETAFQPVMEYKYSYDDSLTGALDREFLKVFTVNWAGDISQLKLEKAEVAKVEWRTLDELTSLIGKDNQWVFVGYEQDLIKKLKSKNWGEL